MTRRTAFLLWADIPRGHEAGFNEWYSREHAPDRVLGIPGFVQARRFAATAGGPGYAALYETTGPEVFSNEAYLAMRRAPDARSREFIPLFRNVIRFVGCPVADAGAVPGAIEGAWARFAAVRMAASADSSGHGRELVDAMVRRPGIVRARLFRADSGLMAGAVKNMQGTTRQSLRGPDRLPDALLMVEGATEAQLAEIEAEANTAVMAGAGVELMAAARMRQLMRVAPNRQET
jgi:hypothetical protein